MKSHIGGNEWLHDNYNFHLGNQACKHVKRSIFSLDKLQSIKKNENSVLKENNCQINYQNEVGILGLVFQTVVLCLEYLSDF